MGFLANIVLDFKTLRNAPRNSEGRFHISETRPRRPMANPKLRLHHLDGAFVLVVLVPNHPVQLLRLQPHHHRPVARHVQRVVDFARQEERHLADTLHEVARLPGLHRVYALARVED